MVGAQNGSEASVNTLLDAGADASPAMDNGKTALMFAAQNDESNIIFKLLEAHADINARARGIGETALMFAAENGKVDAVRELIDHHADVNLKTTEHPGRTALDFANAITDPDKKETVVNALGGAGAHAGLAPADPN
jgi:ankyrin repeat protein